MCYNIILLTTNNVATIQGWLLLKVWHLTSKHSNYIICVYCILYNVRHFGGEDFGEYTAPENLYGEDITYNYML